MIWSVLVRVAQGSRMNLSIWDLHLHFSGIISQSRSVDYLCSLFPGPNSLSHVFGSSFSCAWGELGQRFSVCADVDEEVLVVFPPLESPDGRAPADSALGPLEGRLLPLLYSLRWRRMTANNGSHQTRGWPGDMRPLFLHYECSGLYCEIGSQMKDSPVSLWRGPLPHPAAAEDRPLASAGREVLRSQGRLDDHWLEVWSAWALTAVHPSSPNVTVSTVREKPAIQSQAKALVTESTSKDHFIYSLQIILTV